MTKKTAIRTSLLGTTCVLLGILSILSAGYYPIAHANSGPQITYYDLTLCSPSNGIISTDPDVTTFVANTDVTLTADSDPGYYFAGWTGDLSGYVNPTTITMNADKTICANFYVDNTPPVITLLGDSTVNLECGDSYTDAGATAYDDKNGDITDNIEVGGDTVDHETPGTYTITYDVHDEALNDAEQVTRTVIVADTTVPIISLLGDNPMEVIQTATFTDPGATAIDDCDGDLTSSIVVGGDTVNTATVGTYVLTYDVEDAEENAATQVTRTVNVVADTTAPVITLIGDNPLLVGQTLEYEDPGATAYDNLDGDLTTSIVVGGDVVDVDTLGDYVVTYDVSDAASNAATQVSRTVSVVDVIPPLITLIENEILYMEYLDTYSEPGATALDAVDGDLTANIVIGGQTVDSSTLDTYTVTYTVADAAGNEGSKNRFVFVRDTTNPGISLLGDNPMTVAYEGTFTDPGATAADNYDGNLTANITVGGDTVDPNNPGSYLITYDVTDSQGNQATQAIRTVTVPEPGPKVLTVTGPSNGSVTLSPPDPVVIVASGAGNHDETYDYGTNVSLFATPNTGYIFGGWGGAAAGQSNAVTLLDEFDDGSLDSGWTVLAGVWGEDVVGYLTVASQSNVSPALSRGQSLSSARFFYDYQRVAGSAPLENTLLWVDSSNAAWLEVSATQIALKETVGGTEATLETAALDSYLGTWYTLEIEVHDGVVTVWRGVNDGPCQFVLKGSSTHSTTTVFEWATGANTAYAFDHFEIHELDAQATVVMDDDKTVSATFLAEDATAPVLTLLGSSTIDLDCGDIFTDPGATASDDRYGDITSDIVVGGDVINTASPGTFVITYDVMDREGNAATQITRTVTVSTTDVSLPEIILIGDPILYLDLNDTYEELGAHAIDLCDFDLPEVTIDSSTVNTSVYGEYTVTYDVSDNSSNAAVQVTRTIRVWPSLDLDVSGYGYTTPEASTTYYFAADTVVDLSAERTPYSHFTGWTGDTVANATASETTITMDGPKSVTANFEDGYVVTLSVLGDGTLSYLQDSTTYHEKWPPKSGQCVKCIS